MSDHKTMTLTLNVWRQKGPNQPGKFETYTAKGITEHHSFLEMIDVVNEDSSNQEKSRSSSITTAVRESVVCVLRLSTVCPMEARRGPPSASSTCGNSRMGTQSSSNHGVQLHSRSSRTWSLIVVPMTPSSRPAVIPPATPAVCLTVMLCWCPSQMRIMPWTQPNVLVVEPVQLPAQIARQCSLLQPRWPSWQLFPREKLKPLPVSRRWLRQCRSADSATAPTL